MNEVTRVERRERGREGGSGWRQEDGAGGAAGAQTHNHMGQPHQQHCHLDLPRIAVNEGERRDGIT